MPATPTMALWLLANLLKAGAILRFLWGCCLRLELGTQEFGIRVFRVRTSDMGIINDISIF